MRFVNRNNARVVALALFLLPIAGTKEKAKQKENAVKGISPSAEGDRRLCLWKPPPFEKGGRKLQKTRRVVVFLPSCRHYLRVKSSPFGE